MSKRKRWAGIISLLAVLALFVSFIASPATVGVAKSGKGEVYTGKVPKYVFVFIGDGMSYAQVSSAEMYMGQKAMPGKVTPKQVNFTQFPTHGALMTQDSTSFIPDSASTATSLASGQKTLSGVINMDETKTKKYKPITEDLKARGYKIGIITSVPITHATPAAYYAKVASRDDAYDIGKQLAASGFDFFGGGSFDKPTGTNKDQKPIFEIVEEAGYTIADTNEEIRALDKNSGKVVAISPALDGTALNYEIDRNEEKGELSLADFVKEGIEVLDNPKGFFIMTEGGKIDWANHANDAAASIHDTIAFADAVEEAVKFYNKHPEETLILVTADHECGGMTLGFANTGYSTYFEKLQPVTMSYVEFDKILSQYKKTATRDTAKLEDLMDEIKSAYGLSTANLSQYEMGMLRKALDWSMIDKSERKYNEQENILYGTYEPLSVTLCHIVNNKAGLSFTSYSHTGLPVPVYAMGSGADMFNGFYDNTEIYYKLAAITNIS
ncbi:alkaline phosphatase [Desulfocucumis palustris]|uniref:Alkaline phosphatase n=1 Tax=Desulfocucumis palustris TaxID=1898651 RepID=A0A2L2X8P8_9FIRM|nr:alkaline phosphatase [Desulfocucumis palustris]GBF32589.1 alkaline phosphatase [Desulfocucumis palustris]